MIPYFRVPASELVYDIPQLPKKLERNILYGV